VLKFEGDKLVGRRVSVNTGGTTGITDINPDGSPVGNLNRLPGTQETQAEDVVFTRR